ncbi:MAG: sigma-70 family RNA polymerase sigma factor [Lachnospiraceae bacterium]|nr:sigma-70 family RNA polymerase sigma factor [Lachnospiraceae bacterium]
MTAAEQERIYADYRSKVLAYIRNRVNNREDAEDLCEDVFVKAFSTGASYDASKASAGTWIYAITRNTVIDHYRRQRPTEELPEDLASDELPEDTVLQTELMDRLAAALMRLDEQLRDIIVLCYYDHQPLTKVAQKLGLSYGAVKLRHQKALTLLKKAMG